METVDDRGSAPAEGSAVSSATGDTSEILVVCAWCPDLHILRRPEWFAKYYYTLELTLNYPAYDNLRARLIILSGPRVGQAVDLKVSHGICDACKAVHFPPREPSIAGDADTTL